MIQNQNDSSNRNDSKDVRRYRLYIGNGNWINLDKKTTDDLNEIYKAGVPARYELTPGLFIDILPNDVDCNSKNTELSRLMRVDIHYGLDHPPSQQQQEATQQTLSKYVKNLLESQGIIDAFPPLKKPDDLLPLVTSLPSHRHLSMVPASTSTSRRVSRVFRSSRDDEDLAIDLALQPLADPTVTSSTTSLSSLSSTTSSSGTNSRRKRNRPSRRKAKSSNLQSSRAKSGSGISRRRRRTASKTSTEPIPLSSGDVTRRSSLLLDSDRTAGGDDDESQPKPQAGSEGNNMMGSYYASSTANWPSAPSANLDYRNSQDSRTKFFAHNAAAAAAAAAAATLDSPAVLSHHGSGAGAAAVETTHWPYFHTVGNKTYYDFQHFHPEQHGINKRLDITPSSDGFVAAPSYSPSPMLLYHSQQPSHIRRPYQFPPPSSERSTMLLVAQGASMPSTNNSPGNQSFPTMYNNSLLTHHQEQHMHSLHQHNLHDAPSLISSSPPSSSSNTTQLHYMTSHSWTTPPRDVWNMGIEGTNNNDAANGGDTDDREAATTDIDMDHYADMQPHLDYSHHLALNSAAQGEEQQDQHTSSSSSLVVHQSEIQMEESNNSNNQGHHGHFSEEQHQQHQQHGYSGRNSSDSPLHSGAPAATAGIQLQQQQASSRAATNLAIEENFLSTASSPRPSSL